MKYEIVFPSECIDFIKKNGKTNLSIITNCGNNGLYHATIIGNGETLLKTEDIFNSPEIANDIIGKCIESTIVDTLAAEFATEIRYVLSQE